MDAFTQTFVKPHYMRLMGLGALRHGLADAPEVRRLAGLLPPSRVNELLAADWRERVVGAWYAVAHPTPAVRAAVLRSLETSAGSLTAPPLATAAVFLNGSAALPALCTYGSGRFVAAVIETFGGPTPEHLVTEDSDLRHCSIGNGPGLGRSRDRREVPLARNHRPRCSVLVA